MRRDPLLQSPLVRLPNDSAFTLHKLLLHRHEQLHAGGKVQVSPPLPSTTVVSAMPHMLASVPSFREDVRPCAPQQGCR